MEKTLFSANTFTGAIKYSYLNPDNNDQVVIETHHTPQIRDLMVANAEMRKMDDGRWGEMAQVASIPLDVYFRLKQIGIADDPKAFKKWLNNPDNVMFRTKNGEV